MALPSTWALPRGNKTLRREGGAVVPGVTSGDPLALTGNAATAGWGVELIADEFNVTRWMLTVSGTAAQAPPTTISNLANGTTVTGTLTSGANTCAVTITVENPAYDVRPKWSDTTSVFELRQTLSNTVLPVALGDKIYLQPGTYGLVAGVKTSSQRIRFLTPTGTYNGSNSVVIAPRTPFEAEWQGTILDSQLTPTTRNAYLHFRDIYFTVPLLDGSVDPNGVAMVYAVTACNYVKVTNCRLWGEPTEGIPPNGVGRDQTSAFQINGSFWEVSNNDIRNVWNFGAASSLGDTLIITDNDVTDCWNDGFKTNHYNLTVERNFMTNKGCPDPDDQGNGAHPDLLQHLGWSDGVSRTLGTFRQNIIVRGAGRTPWPDGQGIFLQDSKNGSRLLNAVVENNLIIHTMQNGISICNGVDPLVRGNLLLLDPTVGPIVDPNTGTNPSGPYYSKIGFNSGSGGAGGAGGTITGNVSVGATTISSISPTPTQTNNIVLDANASSGASSYSANFAAPVFGSALNSRAAVIAAFKPKVGGPVDLAGAGPLDTSGNFRSYGAATLITFFGPSGGAELVPSTNFTVGADGSITGTVTVTPSDGGAGGTFTPTTVNISSGSPTATFIYTPPAGSATLTISVTNNGGLTNPASIPYTVNAPAVTTVTLIPPDQILVGAAAILTASVDGIAPADIEVSLDPVTGLTFGGSNIIESGASQGTTTITASTTGTKTISGTNDAGLSGPASIDVVAYAPAVTYGNIAALIRCGFIAPIA